MHGGERDRAVAAVLLVRVVHHHALEVVRLHEEVPPTSSGVRKAICYVLSDGPADKSDDRPRSSPVIIIVKKRKNCRTAWIQHYPRLQPFPEKSATQNIFEDGQKTVQTGQDPQQAKYDGNGRGQKTAPNPRGARAHIYVPDADSEARVHGVADEVEDRLVLVRVRDLVKHGERHF